MVLREEVALLFSFSALTFLVVLPALCRTWPHSSYHQVDDHDANDRASVDDELLAIRQARDYLTAVQQHPRPPHLVQQGNLKEKESDDDIKLLVTIVTTQRRGQFYLSRVVARLHQLLNDGQRNAFRIGVQLLICNVDRENVEAIELGAIFPFVQRQPTPLPPDVIEKEKDDYAFCLNASLHHPSPPAYILVLEDDALPTAHLLTVTQHFTAYLNDRHPNFVYVKLYHPERLQGYLQPEPWRIIEWIALSVLLAFIATNIYNVLLLIQRRKGGGGLRRRQLFVFFFAYFMLVTQLVGRVNFELELRRRLFAPALYSLLPATECCTPAMLYSKESAGKVVDFLSSISCQGGYAKDIALYLHVKQTKGLEAFVIEPNLVQHIGRQSTLRGIT